MEPYASYFQDHMIHDGVLIEVMEFQDSHKMEGKLSSMFLLQIFVCEIFWSVLYIK